MLLPCQCELQQKIVFPYACHVFAFYSGTSRFHKECCCTDVKSHQGAGTACVIEASWYKNRCSSHPRVFSACGSVEHGKEVSWSPDACAQGGVVMEDNARPRTVVALTLPWRTWFWMPTPARLLCRLIWSVDWYDRHIRSQTPWDLHGHKLWCCTCWWEQLIRGYTCRGKDGVEKACENTCCFASLCANTCCM